MGGVEGPRQLLRPETAWIAWCSRSHAIHAPATVHPHRSTMWSSELKRAKSGKASCRAVRLPPVPGDADEAGGDSGDEQMHGVVAVRHEIGRAERFVIQARLGVGVAVHR